MANRLVQGRQSVKRDLREDVMFNVVVHVPVQHPQYRIDYHCPGRVAVVWDILCHTDVLSREHNSVDGCSENPRQD